jgi:preprotein translocase SecF subunit
MTLAFRKVQNAFRYGVCAVIAMIHDVAVVFSVAGIGAILFDWQMDALFLTALLTVIGFSVQDKVVVFDRIRENANLLRKLEYEKLVNHSIVQTLQRSINTQLMTVEFLLLAGVVRRHHPAGIFRHPSRPLLAEPAHRSSSRLPFWFVGKPRMETWFKRKKNTI